MEGEQCIPPGFRFHPTEEELVGYYLTRKINSSKIDLNVIVDIDLYKMEPWDVEDRCKMGHEEQSEWYFFSHKDKKHPTGTRTNRATAAGFWTATGRDKAVASGNKLIGMRKTLVFYSGRAPNGRKTDWIMHEYRLQTSEHAPPQDEGWVVCRAFKKPIQIQRPPGYEAWNHSYHLRNRASNVHNLGQQSVPHSILDLTKPPVHGQAGETLANNQLVVEHSTILQNHELFSSENSSSGHHHHQQQLMEVLPQLDSPFSVAYNDIKDYYDDGGSCNMNVEGGAGAGRSLWGNPETKPSQRDYINNGATSSSINSDYSLGFFPDS
ncbi:hypothetical protein MLD38_001618 [Melastoma candidum]|uniref:Uncharacterized protein n=1 Tax=Melastoma candidum TaxID=119954 RepID=A0ACB9SIR2_9MYRT|nr:hypothetical protein MLD38_001618 [Melastoma candidum]